DVSGTHVEVRRQTHAHVPLRPDPDLLRPERVLQLAAIMSTHAERGDPRGESRIRWRHDPRIWELGQSRAEPRRQHRIPALDPIHPDLPNELERRTESPHHRWTSRPIVHEPERTCRVIIEAAARERIPDARLHLATDVEDAGALRSEEPFVRTGDVSVAAKV